MTQARIAGRRKGRQALLGIDLGTSSVKTLVTDLSGAVIGHAVGDYPVLRPRPGWSETDPEAWLAATIEAVRAAVAQAEADPVAVGLSGQMHGLVTVDGDGQPLRAAMLWSDSRATEEGEIYRRLPDEVRARLANPVSPGMAGPMLAWVARNEPDTYAAARWALQPKDWLRWHLTGRFATEPSDASATLLYDLTRDTWDAAVLDALGLDGEKLAPMLPSAGSPAGDLTTGGARLLGLASGIPVAAGAADTAAAALGSGLVDPGTAQLTIGTGAQVVRPVAELPADLSADPVTHLYRAATDAGWYAMGAVLNGGSTLTWACQILGATWQELYAAAAIEPGVDDPYFLPHLHGERTPYLDPAMRGAWTDLNPRHHRDHLLHAALEGVAFAVRDALEHVLTTVHLVPELRLAGGGTTDPGWRQMLADVLGYPITAIDISAASGLGAAALGARAAGLTDEASVVARGAPSTRVTTHPDATRSPVYRERHQLFQQRVRSLCLSSAPRPVEPSGDPQPKRSV